MNQLAMRLAAVLLSMLCVQVNAATAADGKAIYDRTCVACHGTGATGAPKMGDAAAWAPRIKTGEKALIASAIKGKGVMPAKGGNASLSNAEIQAAVNYIISQSSSGSKSAEAAAVPAAVAAGSGDASGKAVYDSTCGACHATGAAGAPKTGDATAWAPRIKTGQAALVASATKGKGAMPAKGGNAKLTDAEMQAAVKYIVSQSGSGAKSAEAAVPPTATAAAPAVAAAGGGDAGGKAVYDSTCGACHATGAAGAPKTGDAAAWAPRIKAGQAALVASATKGKGAMPAKGGNAKLTDAELQAAVKYIISQSGPGAKNAEAAGPSAAPSAAAAAPAVVAAAPVAASAEAPPAAAGGVNTFNRLMQPAAKRNLPPAEDGIHDPANDGTNSLQPPLAAFGALTKSNDGNRVDWVKSLNESKINPRFDRNDPNAKPMVMDMNIVREVKGSMPDVVYPHKEHTQWLDCSNCHPAIFIPQKGANQISMAAILLGQKCGVCHGKVAFPVSDCRRCHSKAKTPVVKAAVKP
jgi:c(7)-type cytochrome triheme protein